MYTIALSLVVILRVKFEKCEEAGFFYVNVFGWDDLVIGVFCVWFNYWDCINNIPIV